MIETIKQLTKELKGKNLVDIYSNSFKFLHR